MFIDIHVHPAFYEPINEDPAREDLRHEALDIHKNGTAPLEHIFNQMQCAGLDKLCLLPEDYSGSVGCLVTNEEIKKLVDMARTSSSALLPWIPGIPKPAASWSMPSGI